MKKVKIIDAIMGSGKTYDAIERMKKHKGNFIYVTPFKKEIERVVNAVPKAFQPIVTSSIDPFTRGKITNNKRANLLKMANGGANIVTSHALFETLHKSDYIDFQDYDLILDEVLNPIYVLDMKPDDIKIAINQGLIVVNPNTGKVAYLSNSYRGNYYKQLRKYCDTANLIYLDGRLLVWAFPPEIFQCFKSVTVLTYLFEGSLLAAYFKYYNISYAPPIINKLEEKAIKAKIKQLLNIYEGPANNVGNRQNAFNVTWLENRTDKELRKISKSAVNLTKRVFKTQKEFNAYTTFKNYRFKLKGSGYTNGFISVNARATNEHSHKETMLYFANWYLEPNIKLFFLDRNIKVNQDQWALGQLLQWIWRGCIRDEKPMNLYIPSKRMRNLLKDWLNN